MKECDEYRKSFHDTIAAVHRAAVEDELRWLKEQHQKGQLSEAVCLERQRELVKAWRKTDGKAPNGDPAVSPGNSGVEDGPPSGS